MRLRYKTAGLCLAACLTAALLFTRSPAYVSTYGGIPSPSQMAVTRQPPALFYVEDIPLPRPLQRYTYALCDEMQVDYDLILAVMWKESRFQTDAVHVNSNGTRDSGIMQINDINSEWMAQKLEITDLMDPRQNIRAGVTIIAGFVHRYGIHDGVMAYNLGEAGMKRAKERGVTSTDISQSIMEKMAQFKERQKLP